MNAVSLAEPVVFPLYAIKGGKCACGHDACGRVGKHPAVKWGELAAGDAVPRPEPGAGIGLKTGAAPKGSGVFVLDIDTADALLRANELGGCDETLVVETGRGWQFYFEHPGFRVKNSAGDLGKGLDVRGDGGFVVAPGSPHKSGKVYEVAQDYPIAPAPGWLLSWLRAQRAPTESQMYDGDVEPGTPEHARRRELYTAYLKTDAPARGPERRGQGDATLFTVVQRGAYDLALPVDDILELVREHYDPRCDPQWDDELDERVHHKARCAKEQSTRPAMPPLPADLAHLATGADPPIAAPSIESGVHAVAPKATDGRLGFDFDDWEEEPPPIEFLVGGLVPRGCVGMIYGRADSLKTWLLFSLGVAVAKGEPWLGKFPTTRGRVGLVDYETGRHNVKRRLYMLRAGKLGGQLATKSFANLKPNQRDFWVALAKEDFDLAIVDSLRKANPGADENDSDEATVPLALAAEFSELTGCAVLFIHHAKKSSDDGWPEFRGSAAIEDQVDVAYGARKLDLSPEKKRVEIRCEKPGDMRAPDPFAVEIAFDDFERTAVLSLAEGEAPIDGRSDALRKAIVALLSTGPFAGGKDGLARALRRKAEDVRGEVDALAQERRIVCLPGQGYVLDSPEARRARVLGATGIPGMSTPGKLAKAAHVDEDEVLGMLAAGGLFRSGSGYVVPT